MKEKFSPEVTVERDSAVPADWTKSNEVVFQHHLIGWLMYQATPSEQASYGLDPALAERFNADLREGRLPANFSSPLELQIYIQNRIAFGKLRQEKSSVIPRPAY